MTAPLRIVFYERIPANAKTTVEVQRGACIYSPSGDTPGVDFDWELGRKVSLCDAIAPYISENTEIIVENVLACPFGVLDLDATTELEKRIRAAIRIEQMAAVEEHFSESKIEEETTM